MREMKSKTLNKGNGKENEMGFFTLENGTEMNILEMVCAKKVGYLNLENEGIIHDFNQKIIEEAKEVAAYDHFFNENISRKGRNRKTKNNGKRNADKAKRLHKADRYHGKHLEPYLYKEDGIIKESIEDVWKRCRYPVSNKVHNHSALKADAREQDFFLNPSVSEMEIEQEEKRMSEEEERILDNHYMVETALSNFLKEGKYISLLSYWNGEYWEDSDSGTNQFCGIKTAEEVKDAILTEQAKHLDLSKIEMDTVHEMTGVSFKWDDFYGWDDEKRGYIKLTFLPLLPLN